MKSLFFNQFSNFFFKGRYRCLLLNFNIFLPYSYRRRRHQRFSKASKNLVKNLIVIFKTLKNFFKFFFLLVCCSQKVIFLLNEFVFGEKLTAAAVAATKRRRAILLARAIFLAKVEHIRILIFGLRVLFSKKKAP